MTNLPKTILYGILAIWYFIIYGIPVIWVAKPWPEKGKRDIIKRAWLAAKLTSVTYKIRRDK